MAVHYAVDSTDATILVTEYTMATGNATEATVLLKRNELLVIFELIVSGLIIVGALFGNLVVVNTLWRKRKNLTRMHFFIYHLCIADIITALFSQFPLFIWDITFYFHGPNFVCKLVKFFQLFPIYLSSYILILTAFDRYLAICHPLLGLRGNQKLRMRTMVVLAWVLSAIFATPQMYFFSLTYIEQYGGWSCWVAFKSLFVARLYVTFFTLFIYAIPTLLLAVIYGQICLAVWQNMGKATGHTKPNKHVSRSHNESWDDDEEHNGVEMKREANSHSKQERQTPLYRSHTAESRVSRAKIKTIKMTLTIVTVYIVCWSPFFFALVCEVWDILVLHSKYIWSYIEQHFNLVIQNKSSLSYS